MASSENNVVVLLKRSAERVPGRSALVFRRPGGQDESIGFGELWDRVGRVAAGLRARGLQPRQRVLMAIPMSLELYVALLSVLAAGAVAVFLDPWLVRRHIGSLAALIQPAAMLGTAKSHLLRVKYPSLRRIGLTVTTGRRLGPLPARYSLLELSSVKGDGQIESVDPQDTALVTFTSGSSGEAKGANRTHSYLTAQNRALVAEFPCLDDDVDMPMFPIFALNNLANGITSVIPRMDFRRVSRVNARVVLDQMHRQGVTTCTASPPFFDRLTEALADGGQRPQLRRVLTGGAPVSDEQLRAWQTVLPDSEILVVYGSTEAEPVSHIAAHERLAARSALYPDAPGYCLGHPSRLVKTKVIRIQQDAVDLGEKGWEDWLVEPGGIGELVVSGDHVCQDYFMNSAATRNNKIADRDGRIWHRMGDTGYFDDGGRFWLTGRVHSTIVRGGTQVHPQLVEQAARGDGTVIKQVAAVGVEDELLGQRVVVVVRAANPSVEQQVRSRLSAAGMPLDELVVTTRPLPVDPRHNSKIDYDKLREQLTNDL